MTVQGIQQNRRNIIHIELLRIIAIWLVMFNHTSTRGFTFFTVAQESPLSFIYIFISIADKVAVPIFMMISGALLLGKEESLKDLYTKRVAKFVIVLLVTSVFYYVYNWYFNDGSLKVLSLLKTIYCYNAAPALWFLYGYIAVLVMLPLLRKMIKGMRKKEYIYLAFCHIALVGCIPILQYRLSAGTITMNGSFSAPLITEPFIFYFIMGYFFENILEKEKYNWKNVLWGCILSIIAISICCYMTLYEIERSGQCNDNVSQVFHNSLIAIPTFTLYFSVKTFFMRIEPGERMRKAIQILGSCTFGIYLMEAMLRQRTVFVFEWLQPVIGTLPACFVWITVCFLVGFVITWVIKKIPFVNRYI